MLPPPRIIVIDDNADHLRALADGLNRHGAACLQIQFAGDASEVRRCPYVRVIFADLHLNESGAATDNARHFAVLGGLIEEHIAPAGPYALVLWTRFPDEANALREFLNERLQSIPKPFSVSALDKNAYIDAANNVQDAAGLVAAITNVVTQLPPAAALLNWEESVLSAAAETVSALMELSEKTRGDLTGGQQLARLLRQLATEAVGETHVDKDRFHAVNEALLPILADRVAFVRAQSRAEELWTNAFADIPADTKSLSLEEGSRLNHLLHVAEPGVGMTGGERGAVVALDSIVVGEGGFSQVFGSSPEEVASKQFLCSGWPGAEQSLRWVLLQIQASCDFAQRQPGPLPFVLGLEMPFGKASQSTPPGAIYKLPVFDMDGEIRVLHLNARFQMSVPSDRAAEAKILYRIREPLLSLITYSLHSYGARPGIVSFKAEKKTTQPTATKPSRKT